ncbi:hypothetical protein [Pseudobdellovibrio exovorus]|uniref:Uncharacterized protein n=1 Tax=Pseudobdellovibrio exovorus JSS TaxID=1184267 RepID=M4V8E0_9BACT|nr:hypothetical protein [Pseudobdellovibrio exovorus]AGH94725.1 hypothetical protein A11Q_505 [Pseudobdellovibrio exovorus JSS]
MKQLLVIAIALTAINAQASRARVNALGGAAHLVDTATVHNNPADIFALPSDYVAFETGATGALAQTAQNANAEGMIVRSMGDSKLGLSLGHQSVNAASWGLRGVVTNAALRVNQQNPLELTYGAKAADLAWAGTLVYSNYHDKQAAGAVVSKESSLGARFGVRASNWDAALRLGLGSNVELADSAKSEGNFSAGLNGGYWMENIYLHGAFSTASGKEKDNTGAELLKVNQQQISVGALATHKKDGSELFYGVQLVSTEQKDFFVKDRKTTSLTLPLVIGVEVDAASWLTFRGSVTQTTLINDAKTETAGVTNANTAPGIQNTAVNLGAGLKFNKLTVDGTLSTATTQTVDTTNLLAQVGATYWF